MYPPIQYQRDRNVQQLLTFRPKLPQTSESKTGISAVRFSSTLWGIKTFLNAPNARRATIRTSTRWSWGEGKGVHQGRGAYQVSLLVLATGRQDESLLELEETVVAAAAIRKRRGSEVTITLPLSLPSCPENLHTSWFILVLGPMLPRPPSSNCIDYQR